MQEFSRAMQILPVRRCGIRTMVRAEGPMHHETLHALISLYHGEVAAEKAYERAARRFADQPEEPVLQRLELAHAEASERLAEEIRMAGVVVPEPSGAWEVFAETVESVAAFLNDDVALYVLMRGEQIGMHAYEKALSSPYVPQALNRLLTDLMLECRGHIIHDLRLLRSHVLEVQDRPLL
jgi:hypothetical protein